MHHHQEKYTFKCHSYPDNLREALEDMMTSNEFADVTLYTDDKQQIRAHRNILSACSPVFKSILQIDSNSTNPVVYLRGIQYSEMESIMQFIYLGKARLYEERITEFLMISKNLEIKDLSNGVMKYSPDDIKINDQTVSNEERDENVIANDEENFDYDTMSSLNESSVNVEPRTKTTPTITNQSVNRKVTRKEVVSGDSKFHCQDCEHLFSTRPALWRHIKAKHEGVKYACHQCDYQATYRVLHIWRNDLPRSKHG